jgi:hypothetical protein
MKKFFILLVPLIALGAYFFLKEPKRCDSCNASKDKFFFLISPPGKNLGIEKALAAHKQEYKHFRVVFWEEEVNESLKRFIEKYPNRFEIYKSPEKGLLRIYRLLHAIPQSDIVVMMSSEMSDPHYLSRLNDQYQNKKILSNTTSFYVGLFREIKLENILTHKDSKDWIALLPKQIKARPKQKKADVVVFSFDRPLQLYSFLESLEKFVTNIGETLVVYRTSHADFENGYTVVKKRFPAVKFLPQGAKPKKDFKPLVLKASFKSPSPYILFAVDDIIIRSPINVEECVDYLEDTGALGFYLRLGTNTDYCNGPQLQGKPAFQGIPLSLQLNDQVFAWQFQDGRDDWRYPHTVDMTLFRKEDIRKTFEDLPFNHPNNLEGLWSQKAQLNQVGLYYKTSKIVNLPLNLVNAPENRHVGSYTAVQLLDKFKAGLKFNIQPLETFNNRSAHTDFDVTFIKRVDE